MKSQGIADFRVPPPMLKVIDTFHAMNELPSYDSFKPAPDDFKIPTPRIRNGSRVCTMPFFVTKLAMAPSA
jgi:hypothetical protein